MAFDPYRLLWCELHAARAIGLAEADCFSTPDLFEFKNVGQVRVASALVLRLACVFLAGLSKRVVCSALFVAVLCRW